GKEKVKTAGVRVFAFRDAEVGGTEDNWGDIDCCFLCWFCLLPQVVKILLYSPFVPCFGATRQISFYVALHSMCIRGTLALTLTLTLTLTPSKVASNSRQ
ncbi:unnamed protein product, partial [Discosporangium mesarthrocarpum]